MKDEDNLETINKAIEENLRYKFEKANIPMIKFYIHEEEENIFTISSLFADNENLSIKVKVLNFIESENTLRLLSKSGTMEFENTSLRPSDFFSKFSSEIFKKIASEAARLKANKSGKNVDQGSLKRVDSDERIKTDYITYVDFEHLDIQDIDWSEIYIY